MIRALVLTLALASPAYAATITPAVGLDELTYIEGVGFRPLDGIQTYEGGKNPCPWVVTWQHNFDLRRTRERQCPVPDDMFAGAEYQYEFAAHMPLGVLLDTVAHSYSTQTSTGGGGGCCGGNNPPHVTPEPIAPVPLPASAWMLLLALGGLIGMKRRLI